jgi:hypothetical protein
MHVECLVVNGKHILAHAHCFFSFKVLNFYGISNFLMSYGIRLSVSI